MGKGIDWDKEPLGIEADASIARRLGVRRSSVRGQREKRGLPSPVCAGVHRGIKWDEQPLGTVPDCELARRLGVSQQAVSSARRHRGIAAAPYGATTNHGGRKPRPKPTTGPVRNASDDVAAFIAAGGTIRVFTHADTVKALAPRYRALAGHGAKGWKGKHDDEPATKRARGLG